MGRGEKGEGREEGMEEKWGGEERARGKGGGEKRAKGKGGGDGGEMMPLPTFIVCVDYKYNTYVCLV